MRQLLFVLFALTAVCCFAAAPPAGTIQVTSVSWKDGPPSLPKGTKVAVLEGDPKGPGLFTMRLLVPAGTKLPPHWHPRAERVTVLRGEARVGFGDVFDEKQTSPFRAGSFYVNAPDVHHYVWFTKLTELQLTCEGPWELNLVSVK